MNIIKKEDIYFDRLDMLHCRQASRSYIYIQDRELVYKILKNPTSQHKEVLDIFSSYNKDFLIKIKSYIMSESKGNMLLDGYQYKYIEGDVLQNFIIKNEPEVYIKVLEETSKKLKEFHSLDGRPVFGDFHFYNIIIDNLLRPHFIDIEDCGVYDYRCNALPNEYLDYCDFKDYPIEKNQSADRLNFMLELFKNIYGRNVLSIGDYTFEESLEKHPELSYLKQIYKELNKDHIGIPDVPYLYQLKE